MRFRASALILQIFHNLRYLSDPTTYKAYKKQFGKDENEKSYYKVSLAANKLCI